MKHAGMKWDGRKPRLSLVPPHTDTCIAEVMTDAVEREKDPYVVNSWRSVRPVSRYLDALLRHVEEIKAGVKLDPDSKLPHTWHVLTNASFLVHFEAEGHRLIPEPYNDGNSPVSSTKEVLNLEYVNLSTSCDSGDV